MNMMKIIFAGAELLITILCGVGSYMGIINYFNHNNQLDLFGGIALGLTTILGLLCFIRILKKD